ncbi:phosphatase PAP2 family protein [Hymenobacter sp. H14-R3]|uniref:phosphatase PAP2 family protein n=1 Tax=Hymenobacter sp. H14-R3 TaxID=3046308 RepID=UPI0024B99986|nr:phosphatase PAP2 family protein [Hymenobacter sp. H14-R3]MDJ0366661.1 phosphatase PAP2 family protein [Hymenobacter sp. H14-R3]
MPLPAILHQLTTLDHRLLLAINHARTPALDAVMTFASQIKVWFPFYAVLLGWLIYHFRRQALLLLPLLAATVALADSITSRVFKPWAARARPCHAADLAAQLYLPDGCGGAYGFMSSHAANAMGLAVFLLFTLPASRFRWLKAGVFAWAGVISYSRVYLAAHYPLDVLAGWLVGAALGAGAGWAFRRWATHYWPQATT